MTHIDEFGRAAVTSAIIGAFSAWAQGADAAWGNPLTPPSSRFDGMGSQACPSGGWKEMHDEFPTAGYLPLPEYAGCASQQCNTLPIYCPRSYNDYQANHMHGSMHATAFLHSDNGFYGIYDGTGNVYGSSDIAIRLDPTNFYANPDESQGYVDMWIYRNFSGMIVRNPHDAQHFHADCTGGGLTYDPLQHPSAFKTEALEQTQCPPQALRRAKEPAVATLYAGFFTTTYVAWLESEQSTYDVAPAASQKSWKLYVDSVAHYNLNRQQQAPQPLVAGLANGGALNQDATKDAHSPKVTVVGGNPWVVWAEDRDTGFHDTHVKAYEKQTWVTKGAVLNTGEDKNCYGQTHPPMATNTGLNYGYSTDITTVTTTTFGDVAAIVSASEISGECRLVVRMFYNGAWQPVGTAGAPNPGQTSGLIGDGTPSMNPRIVGTATGDLYVVWQEGSTVRASTAHVATGGSAAWKDLTGPYSGGHWGNGSFPSLVVTPFAASGTQYNMLSIASQKGTTVSVDRGRVGMVTNTEGFVQATRDLVAGVSANVTTDGRGMALPSSDAWTVPTNLIAATNGQVGVFDNYLISVQRGDNHRASDTGVFVRRGNGS